MVAGRKITEASATKSVRAAVSKTGADAIVCVFTPACAVAQIVQVWWDEVEFSACPWVAWIVPIAQTRAMLSKHTVLTMPPRFAKTLIMPFAHTGIAIASVYR